MLGIAAATLFTPDQEIVLSEHQLRVAFDGDAVIFSDESEIIVKQHGLDKFFNHEQKNQDQPLAQVPNTATDHMGALSTNHIIHIFFLLL